jgi:environmental stress-induced protein Ves
VPSDLNIIRKSSFTAVPWKNGGGTTHEAIRVPAGGESFLWRVSVAYIDTSGPFSDFAGYRRNMVLLRGRGLRLKFDNGEHRVLRSIGDTAAFEGAAGTYCDLLDGPCVDLNFMVSKSVQADARVVHLGENLTLQASPDTALIFSIEASLLLDSEGGESIRLEPWDLAVVSRGTTRLSRIEPGKLSAPSAVFLATISH